MSNRGEGEEKRGGGQRGRAEGGGERGEGGGGRGRGGVYRFSYTIYCYMSARQVYFPVYLLFNTVQNMVILLSIFVIHT